MRRPLKTITLKSTSAAATANADSRWNASIQSKKLTARG